MVQSHKFTRKFVPEELLFLVLNYSDTYVSVVGEVRVLAVHQSNHVYVRKKTNNCSFFEVKLKEKKNSE